MGCRVASASECGVLETKIPTYFLFVCYSLWLPLSLSVFCVLQNQRVYQRDLLLALAENDIMIGRIVILYFFFFALYLSTSRHTLEHKRKRELHLLRFVVGRSVLWSYLNSISWQPAIISRFINSHSRNCIFGSGPAGSVNRNSLNCL